MKTTCNALAMVLLGAPLLAVGCQDSSLAGPSSDESRGDDDWADDDAASDDDDWGDDDAAGDDDTMPPEEEDDFISVPPQAGDIYVFVVNPTRDSVSKINVQTRQISTIDVGDEPSMVLVTPDYRRAAVFNDGDDSVSVIDVQTDEVETVAVREDFNYMVMSDDGEHAICFLNTALMEDDEFEGVLSFTELSVVDLVGMVSHDFSVGFNPKQVKFADDGDTAVVISDEFITVVDLTENPPQPELIDLGADPFDPPTAAEVEVEPNGEFAFVRYNGEDAIQVVDLDLGDLYWLYAGDGPTDMDLSPDGSDLIVVARSSGEVYTFQASDPLAQSETLSLPATETIGSLSMAPAGDMALLYTTAELTDRVTVWNRATDELEIERLVKPVDKVIMAPDGASVLVVHTLADVAGENDAYTDEYAMTIISIAPGSFIPNPVLLESELESLANFDDGERAVFMMTDNRYVGIIDYTTRLVDDVQMPSYPVFVGVMPEEDGLPSPVAWVSQDHSLGRISFVDPETLELQTVTGFELNSGIE